MNDAANPAALSASLREGQRPWLRAGGAALLSGLLLLLLFRETAASMVSVWMRSDTYAHGFLIVPISAFLIWRQRRALALVTPRPWWPGLALLAGLSLVWLLGQVSDTLLAKQLALVAMVPALAASLLGTAVVRRTAFPLGFLVFAVPWGKVWTPMLQDVTAFLSVRLLELSGIPVFRDGRLISIPAGDFEVAATCSGLRYLVASLALGALYAYLSYRSPWRRLAFIVAAALVPVLANGLRAYGVMLLGHLTDMGWGTGDEHVVLGRLFFLAVMVLLFWLGSFWREDAPNVPPAPGPAAAGAAGALPLVALPVMALLAAGAGPGLAALTGPGAPAPAVRVVLPQASGAWAGPEAPGAAWPVRFKGADQVREAVYRRSGGDGRVRLLVVHYRRQEQGGELINAQNRLVGGAWRSRGGASVRSVALAGGRRLALRELVLDRADGSQRLVWSWYDVAGRRLVTPARAKLRGAIQRLLGDGSAATLVALASDYQYRPGEARARLRAFLAANPGLIDGRGPVAPLAGGRP